MSNSKKRTIGILSVIVLLCACLFFVTLAGNTREKAYATTASSVDLSQTANYTIGTADEVSAFTAVDGANEAFISDGNVLHSAMDASSKGKDVTAAANGATFALVQGYSIYKPVKFVTPLTVGDNDQLNITVNCDISKYDNSYGHIGGYPANPWGTKGILIYPLDATGAAGEGVLIPFTITQRQDVVLSVVGAMLNNFIDADGEIKGFVVAASFSNSINQGWAGEALNTNATVVVKSLELVNTVKTLTSADFTNGKATLFTANGDYTVDTSSVTTVNGATTANYSAWGAGVLNAGMDNIKDITLATTDAYYSFANMKTASNDGGYALATEFNSWGLTSNPYVKFSNKVKVSDIGSLTFRIFANLDNTTDDAKGYCGYSSYLCYGANDPGSSAGTPYNGIFFYGADSDFSYNSGVKLDPFVAQRTWTDVTIVGDDLAKLADSNGYISGMRITAAMISGDASAFYGGAGSNTYDKSACVIIDEITVTAATSVENTVELFDGANGTIRKTVMQQVEGMNRNTLNTAWPALASAMGDPTGLNNAYVDMNDLSASAEGALYDLNAVKSGSADGHAMAMKFSIVGYSMSPTVYFNKIVNTAEVNSVTFRIYANISSDATYGKYNPETGKFVTSTTMKDSEGIYIYSADKNSKGDGFLIKGDVVQREWIEITLCGSDLAKLADANGNIAGFKIGAGLVLNGGMGPYMYNQNAAYDKGNALFIDSVTADINHNAVESDWITDEESTCAKEGSKHTECERCGATIQTAKLELDPSKHNCGELTQEIPAQVGVAGVKAHKQCVDCEKYFDAEGNELDSLVIAPLLGVKQASISTSGDIGLNFYVYVGDVESASATFKVGGFTTDPVAGVKGSDGLFKFSYGVAPKDYQKTVTIEVVGTDIVYSYSVEQYAIDLEDKDPGNAAMPLVNALIAYAETARQYFAEEEVVATEDLTADLTSYKATKAGEDAAVTLLNASLVVEDLTTIKIYFRTADVNAIDVKVDGEDAVVTKIDGEDDLYVVEIANIAAKDLNKAYAVTIGGYTVTYSALSYVQAILALEVEDVALNNVVKAIYNAWVQADAFFN